MNSQIYIASYSSPLAEVNIAASDDGVISLDFNSSVKRFSTSLKERYGTDSRLFDAEPSRFAQLFTLFDRYFQGSRVSFDSVKVDLKGTPFELRVWAKLSKIPYGCTVTYSELAERACSPLGARAASGACGRNPIPLIIPCHRVISSSGALGGYSAGGGGRGLKGTELKRALLGLEGVNLSSNARS